MAHNRASIMTVNLFHYGWNHIGIRSLGTCCAKAR